MKMKKLKILVGIPIPLNQKIPSQLKEDLKNLQGEFDVLFMKDRPEDAFKGERIWRIALARDRIIHHALDYDYSHILFLDSDISFPSETLKVLLSVDADIVSHNYDSKLKKERISQGMGCTLIKRKVFEKCSFSKGMKMRGNFEKGGAGSDILFRKQARKKGFKIINLDRKLNLKHLPYDFTNTLNLWVRNKKSKR